LGDSGEREEEKRKINNLPKGPSKRRDHNLDGSSFRCSISSSTWKNFGKVSREQGERKISWSWTTDHGRRKRDRSSHQAMTMSSKRWMGNRIH